MIAYNKQWMDNSSMMEQVEDAQQRGWITAAEKERVSSAYPVGFYSPNFFIRAGLFIATLVIGSCVSGVFGISMLAISSDTGWAVLCIFLAVIHYGALEFVVRKRHCRSGIDDALLWIAPIYLVAGINLFRELHGAEQWLLIFMLALLLTLRFANFLMAAVAALSFIAFLFFLSIRIGIRTESLISPVLMACSAGMYWLCLDWKKSKSFKYYEKCLTAASIVGLLTFYASCNYYVVGHIGAELLGHLKPDFLPGWLFWTLTALVPPVYIARGIQRRDAVMLRVGLLTLAAAVFTIRYYYPIVPAEWAMAIAGTLMVGISYAIIRYLREPRQGYTHEQLAGDRRAQWAVLENLVIVQGMSAGQHQAPEPVTRFGGGSGGGGGASDTY